MNRGDIYYIEAAGSYTVGSEQRPGRPGIIVSNNKCNESSEVVEVIYTTTQPKSNLPTHVHIESTPRQSTALCEQVNSISKQRIGDYIGRITKAEQQRIDTALLISLDLYTPPEFAGGGKPEQENGGTPAATAEKAQAERDIYKRLYEQLLERILAGK